MPATELTSITLTLGLPDSRLSPNGRTHWASRARAVKAARTIAHVTAYNWLVANKQEPPCWEQATCRATFYWPDLRRRDRDNAAASLKAVWDGLVDSGVLADDDQLTHEPVGFEVDRERPRMEIVVRRNDDQAG